MMLSSMLPKMISLLSSMITLDAMMEQYGNTIVLIPAGQNKSVYTANAGMLMETPRYLQKRTRGMLQQGKNMRLGIM